MSLGSQNREREDAGRAARRQGLARQRHLCLRARPREQARHRGARRGCEGRHPKSCLQAEKQAQANVIRRREESNAMRSTLNTAKLIEDRPSVMRLKGWVRPFGLR